MHVAEPCVNSAASSRQCRSPSSPHSCDSSLRSPYVSGYPEACAAFKFRHRCGECLSSSVPATTTWLRSANEIENHTLSASER